MNSLNNGTFQQFYSRRMQVKHYKSDVFRAIASFEEQAILKEGDTVHRPYRSLVVAQRYTRGQAVAIQDLTNTDQTLTVNTAQIVPYYIDDLDQLQTNYKLINDYADDSAVLLGNLIDADVISAGQIAAGSVVDDGDLGGTAGNYFTVSTANILSVFSAAKKKMKRLNITDGPFFAVISPDMEAKLIDYLAGKNTDLGDASNMNGHIGMFYGFDLYVSNNLPWTGTLKLATNPTAGDFVTISGVQFTFVAAIGTTPGNVLIGGSAAATRANLEALINAPGTTTATGVALSNTRANSVTPSPREMFQGVSATDVTTGGNAWTVVYGKGVSYFTVTASLTAGTDGWVLTQSGQHQLFGKKMGIDVVIQMRPNVEIKDVPDKLGKNVLPWTLYGYNVFAEQVPMLVDIKMRSDNF